MATASSAMSSVSSLRTLLHSSQSLASLCSVSMASSCFRSLSRLILPLAVPVRSSISDAIAVPLSSQSNEMAPGSLSAEDGSGGVHNFLRRNSSFATILSRSSSRLPSQQNVDCVSPWRSAGVIQQQKASSGLESRFLGRHYSTGQDGPPAVEGHKAVPAEGEGDKTANEKPIRKKKRSKKEIYGTYGQEFDDEMAQYPVDESFEYLYDARPIVEDWLGHPTFYDMIEADALAKGTESPEPPGEGPILRWETRVVLGPGGDAFHPANRKVKVSVYVKELGLSPAQRERLLFMVGKRYNTHKDELTIVSERFEQREENRKDVLRTLYSLLEEAEKEPEVVEGTQ